MAASVHHSIVFDCDAAPAVRVSFQQRCCPACKRPKVQQPGAAPAAPVSRARLRHISRALGLGLAPALILGQVTAASALGPRGHYPIHDAIHSVAQDGTTPLGGAQQSGSPGSAHSPQDSDPLAHRVEERMAARRNDERQKILVADTDKLLVLAQQLKADVDRSDKNMLSIDVVKRAEQIEKLARSVKEKMRGN